MNPEDLQLLVTRSMPFGKYKGRIIADLPGDYLNWFAREGVPKGEIGRLLALMHEIDHNGLSDLLKPLRGGCGKRNLIVFACAAGAAVTRPEARAPRVVRIAAIRRRFIKSPASAVWVAPGGYGSF